MSAVQALTQALATQDTLERAETVMAFLEATEEAVRLAQAARRACIAELVRDGMSVKSVALMFDVSRQRVEQILQAEAEEWGPVPVTTAAERLQTARDAYTVAKHAQELRCENTAMGYAEETKAFYGDPSVAQSDHAEDRVRWAGFYQSLSREEQAS